MRLINVTKVAPFEFDQEYAANFAYSVVKEYPIQLIGQGLSIKGLFMGPLYFYYLVPFYFLYSLHPLGGIIGSIIFGLFITLFYYLIGKFFFGYKAGLILAYLRAIFLYKIEADLAVIPSMASEILVLTTWFLLYKYWQKEEKYVPLLTLCFGLYTSIHPIQFPFYFIFLIIVLIKRWIPNMKVVVFSIITFLIPVAPLAIFEYLHNFLEVKNLVALGSIGSNERATMGKLINNILINLREPNLVFGLDLKLKWALFLSMFIVFAIMSFKKYGFWKERFHFLILLITFCVFNIYYTLIPIHVPEYYFLGISVMFLFYTGGVLGELINNHQLFPLTVLSLVFLTVVNLQGLQKSWNYKDSSSLYHKESIVKEIKRINPRDIEFYVSYINYPGWNFGFDYLFKYYDIVPQKREAKRPIYTIVIPKSLAPGSIIFTSGNIGLIVEN